MYAQQCCPATACARSSPDPLCSKALTELTMSQRGKGQENLYNSKLMNTEGIKGLNNHLNSKQPSPLFKYLNQSNLHPASHSMFNNR